MARRPSPSSAGCRRASFARVIALTSRVSVRSLGAKLRSMSASTRVTGIPFSRSVFTERWSPATSSRVTVIRFSVSVPVLSEQMVVTEPSASTAGSFRTSDSRSSKRCAPSASVIVTTAGNPSGTTATAMLIAVRIRVDHSSPRTQPITITRAMSASAASASVLPKLSRRRCNGVGSRSTSWIMLAILPSSVLIPVSVIITRPRP